MENPAPQMSQEWTADQVKALYGYTEPKVAPAQMSVDQIKALYGYVEATQVAEAPISVALVPMSVDQIKALYGYVEEPAAPRVVQVNTHPAHAPDDMD